jgi:epoxyqueuosine reductase
MSITAAIKAEAKNRGFILAGVCPAAAPPGLSRFQAWLDAGFAGEMQYFTKYRDAYEHPRYILEGAKSIVMLALPYHADSSATKCDAGLGRVARYAQGVDYHDVIRARLNRLSTWLTEQSPGCRVRGVVDSAPILEREFAQLAGLGWIGKNTLLLNRQFGSYFFLAVLLTDLELECDEPFAADHCGTCRACLDACPTQAFVGPYQLNATRCISYLTIEQRGSIAEDLREQLGDWVFGCDVCQEVCPWNHHAQVAGDSELTPWPLLQGFDLRQLFFMSDDEFKQHLRDTPLWRPRRRGILRNAALVLGNQGEVDSVPALQRGQADAEPLIRDACTWALARILAKSTRLAE